MVLDSTQHWLGTNDVLMSVYDAEGRSLADDEVPLLVELTAPDGGRVRAQPAIERFATYGRRLYRARVPLDELGRWDIQVSAETDGVASAGEASLEVSPDQGTPALGSLVPGGATPTMRDAHSMMHHISSDPGTVDRLLHVVARRCARPAPADGLRDGLVCVPSERRLRWRAGHPARGLHRLSRPYLIHAEPWHMAPGSEGGMLELDPPGGPAVLTDYAEAWGITEPPWVFVIDREGRLHAKFTGVIGSDELRAAITSVTPWRPVGS